MTTSEFLLSVLSSLIASLLFVFVSIKLSKNVKWLFVGILSRLVDSDLEYVYRNKEDLNSDLEREIKNAKFVNVLAGKGSDLQRDPYSSIFNDIAKYSDKKINILLPQILTKENEINWTNQNDADMALFDKAYGNGLLQQQIIASIKFLEKYVQTKQVELQFYNFPHVGRIIITERFAFYTPYGIEKQSRKCKVYKYRKGGEMYENYSRLFELLWNVNDKNVLKWN